MTRIFMIVNSYAPDDPRVISAARTAVELGHTVHLLGAARNSDRVVPTRQEIHGISIQIVPQARSLRESIGMLGELLTGRLRETVQADSRYRTSLLSMLFFNLWVLRLGMRQRMDLVHCHDLSPLPAAWLVARLKRARLIYDAHEHVPSLYPGRKGRIMAALERFLLRRVDVVITVGERLAQALREGGAREVVLIGNWKRLEDYEIPPETIAQKRRELGIPDDAIVLTYVGTLDPTRELRPLLAALRERPDVHLIVAGRGLLVDEVKQAAQECANIHWLGWIDASDVPLYTLSADAVYCCLEKQRYAQKNYYVLANKLFEAYAAGVPIIALRDGSEMQALLEKSGAGILLDEATPQTLHRVFDQLRDRDTWNTLSARAKAASEHYHWGVARQRLQAVYDLSSQSS